MATEFEYEVHDGSGWILLRRTGTGGVATRAEREAFNQCLREASDDPRTGVICISFTGPPGAAAAPAPEVRAAAHAAGDERVELGDLLVSPKPVVAGIDGTIDGWWLELALQCDLRIAATGAGLQFDLTGRDANERIVTWFLPRLIGVSQAAWLLYSGEYLSAREGHELGLFCSVVEPEWLREETGRMAESFQRAPGATLQRLRSLLFGGLGRSLAEHLTSSV